MATIRIHNVPLEPRKHIWVALKSAIYGIGRTRAFEICKNSGVESHKKVSELSNDEVQAIADACSKYQLEGDLRRTVQLAIKRLREIGCYRGRRIAQRLPVRGQRTRTNARTCKGSRGKAVGSKK